MSSLSFIKKTYFLSSSFIEKKNRSYYRKPQLVKYRVEDPSPNWYIYNYNTWDSGIMSKDRTERLHEEQVPC